MTTREEQAEHKSWLDSTCEPHPELWAERQRKIDEGVSVPLSEKQAQVHRVVTFCGLVKEGKLASAAHVQREWLKHNPWANGEIATQFKENNNG